MVKLSKKQSLAYRMELTAWFGLAIFLLGLLAQIVVFIKVWDDYVHLPTLIYDHVASFVISSGLAVLAAVVPPLIAFFAGEALAKPRARYEPLYNGVLFAFLAIWLSATFGVIFYSYVSMPAALTAAFEYLQYLPQVAALLVIMLLAFIYGKRYKHVALHDFKPYQLLLLCSVAVLFVMGIVSLMGTFQHQVFELNALACLSILIAMGMIAIPYIFGHDKNILTRTTHALIAGSIGFWALAAMGTLVTSVPKFESLQLIIPSVTGLAAWVVYIYLLHRHNA